MKLAKFKFCFDSIKSYLINYNVMALSERNTFLNSDCSKKGWIEMCKTY